MWRTPALPSSPPVRPALLCSVQPAAAGRELLGGPPGQCNALVTAAGCLPPCPPPPAQLPFTPPPPSLTPVPSPNLSSLAGQLHVTQNEGCTPAELLAVFPVAAPDQYFFPYSEVSAAQPLACMPLACMPQDSPCRMCCGCCGCCCHRTLPHALVFLCLSHCRWHRHCTPTLPAGLPARQHHRLFLRRQGQQRRAVEAGGQRPPV